MPLTATMRPSHKRLGDAVQRGASLRRGAGPRRRKSRAAGRRHRRRWAGRGSAGPPGRRTRLAIGAHREAGHRRGGPVVGDSEHDRVARPAVRAVRERVVVAAVLRVVDLGQAVVASGAVDADGRVRGLGRLVLSTMRKPS